MSESNWLDGPWTVAEKGTYPEDEGWKVLGPDGYPRYYMAQFVASEAVAHLIAAAPELYQALDALMGADDKLTVAIGGNPNYVDAFVAKVHAVLTKTKGPQS